MLTGLWCDKVDRRTARPRIIMEIFSPFRDELTATSDTSNALSIIGEPYLKLPVNVVRVRVFLQGKPNDQSSFVLHPAVKNLHEQRR
jgi:hypothetical protein